MLAQMAINIAAARALLYRTCAMMDETEALRLYLRSDGSAVDPERARLVEEMEHDVQLVRFFTPLCKYYATEISNHVTRQAIQVHGGIGYMAESPVGHYHSDSIITTIYEGTSEIQASFALKEMSKGALFTTLDRTRGELERLRPSYPELVALVCHGIEWIQESVPALMGDPQYALLNAKRLCEMVIDVVVAAELLLQSDASEQRRELAQHVQVVGQWRRRERLLAIHDERRGARAELIDEVLELVTGARHATWRHVPRVHRGREPDDEHRARGIHEGGLRQALPARPGCCEARCNPADRERRECAARAPDSYTTQDMAQQMRLADVLPAAARAPTPRAGEQRNQQREREEPRGTQEVQIVEIHAASLVDAIDARSTPTRPRPSVAASASAPPSGQ